MSTNFGTFEFTKEINFQSLNDGPFLKKYQLNYKFTDAHCTHT